MGLVLMSEHELQRVEVLSRVLDGTMRSATAASILAISLRQVQRLLLRYQMDGAGAIRHGLRGRRSNNQITSGLRDYALVLVRESYSDFGPTLAAEKLVERHRLKVSAETLRKWMIEDGLWKNRAQRRSIRLARKAPAASSGWISALSAALRKLPHWQQNDPINALFADGPFALHPERRQPVPTALCVQSGPGLAHCPLARTRHFYFVRQATN